MAAALRPLSRRPWPALLAALVAGVPLVWAAALALLAACDLTGWRLFFSDTQWLRAQGLSVATGLAATALSWGLAAWLLSHSFPGPRWAAVVRGLAPLLAVPHAAFAIGLLFLISPSGWLLRLVSPWATGFDAPPPWVTSQDPWGFGLVLVLMAKEVPFLLWAAAAHLQRPDVGHRLTRELQVAASMGYQPQTAWWAIAWPQLWQKLWAPTLAVLAYSLTVVDMALVIGPTSPPTLAVLAWQWLIDADADINAQGAAAAWWLAVTVALCAGLLWLLRGGVGRVGRTDGKRGRWLARANPTLNHGTPALPVGPYRGTFFSVLPMGKLVQVWGAVAGLPLPFWGLLGLYLVVLLSLLVGSISGVWPFPSLWPESLSLQGWQAVLRSSGTVGTSVALGVAAAGAALVWSVMWLEWAPLHWDRWLRQLVYLPLLLPSVLWVLGVHRLSLAWGVDGQALGLWLVHVMAALPYVLVALSPAYQSFDERHGQVAASLGQRRAVFLLRVKWPLLKAALASACAVGFAVSVAQYLPTLFVGAGRYATVTTEAVTLASGAQRSMTAAYAWLQWLLPVLGFALAAWVGRPRQFARRSATHMPAVARGAA